MESIQTESLDMLSRGSDSADRRWMRRQSYMAFLAVLLPSPHFLQVVFDFGQPRLEDQVMVKPQTAQCRLFLLF